MTSSTAEPGATRCDAFLGGALLLEQPVRGYRAGMDAVLLAAACPARPGERVLELGCGAGAAVLALSRRVAGIEAAGLEVQGKYAALARANAAGNGLSLEVVEGDLAAMPEALRGRSFDHVIANPPFFAAGPSAPDAGRSRARHETTPLAVWADAGLRRLRPGGWLTLILPAGRMGSLLAALEGRGGDARVLPVAPRDGRPAGRVIVAARKGAKAPLTLLPPLVLHAQAAHLTDGEDLTPAAQAVLRRGAALSLAFVQTG
ncbi:methyltransferase [Paracoccus sp. S-4012]|uniref:tRNA1(Val) (adenine(37)-N6)-methyltransferase n=1 Tax=Paracoccus sp. S-4012 TaxID=2665648 RepID=UPI0012B053C7|nr:methyltransferase [Paracoccus sp. S-4012]MRX49116.1 methyltransferase [Paracoccus sp. S-4012]